MAEFDAFAPEPPDSPGGDTPTILGLGFLSTTGAARARLLPYQEVDDARFVPHVEPTATLIDSRSAYARAVSWSARAKFGFVGGATAIRADHAKTFRSSQRKVILALRKYVEHKEFTLSSDHFPKEEADFFESRPSAFLQRFGDQIIASVKTGGLLTILYNLTFESKQEASDFSASGSWQSLQAGGAANYSERVRKSASKARVHLDAYCAGAMDAPSLFGPQRAGDRRVGDIEFGSETANELVRYFDGFEEAVFKADSMSPITLTSKPLFELRGAPASMERLKRNIRDRAEVLERAEKLDDEIDRLRSEATYFLEAAHQWNPGQPREPAEQIVSRLGEFDIALARTVAAVAELETEDLKLPFSADDLPKIPTTWKVNAWVLVDQSRIISTETEPRFEIKLDLRDFVPGLPARIELETIFLEKDRSASRAKWSVAVADANGNDLVVVEQEDLPRFDAVHRSALAPRRSAEPRKLSYVVALPEAAAKVVFRCEKRGLALRAGWFRVFI